MEKCKKRKKKPLAGVEPATLRLDCEWISKGVAIGEFICCELTVSRATIALQGPVGDFWHHFNSLSLKYVYSPHTGNRHRGRLNEIEW